MHAAPVLVVELLQFLFPLVEEGVLLLLHVVPALEEEPRVLDCEVFAFVDLHALVPLPHCPLLLLFELVQLSVGQHFGPELLLHLPLLLLRPPLGQLLQVFLVFGLSEGAPGDGLAEGDDGV